MCIVCFVVSHSFPSSRVSAFPQVDIPLPPAILRLMSATPQQVTQDALRLPERDRLRVAVAIWKSVGATEETLNDLAALVRAHELDSGTVTPKSQTETFKNARAVMG